MSKIVIEREHGLGREAAQAKFREVEGKLKDRYNVTLNWRGDEADLKGPGVTGVLRIDERVIRLDAKLGLMLRPLKGKIEQSIQRTLDKSLGPA